MSNSCPQYGPYLWNRKIQETLKLRAKTLCLSLLLSTNLLSPKISTSLICILTSTLRPLASRPFPYRPFAYVQYTTEGSRGAGGCLSPSHSLWLSFYLSPRSVNTSLPSLSWPTPVRLALTVASFCRLIAVRSSVTSRSSFLTSSPIKLVWPAFWLTQSQTALKPDGYVYTEYRTM